MEIYHDFTRIGRFNLTLCHQIEMYDKNINLGSICTTIGPYSRQVTEQLSLSGSFHSHQLVYRKAGNPASFENHCALEINLMYIVVYLRPPLGSTCYACLTIISRCIPGESKIENCIFDQKHDIWHRTFNPRKLTSVAWCALAQQCIFHFTLPPIRWTYLGELKRKFIRDNPAIFGKITRITHNTLFMHFVLLNHQFYIP